MSKPLNRYRYRSIPRLRKDISQTETETETKSLFAFLPGRYLVDKGREKSDIINFIENSNTFRLYHFNHIVDVYENENDGTESLWL